MTDKMAETITTHKMVYGFKKTMVFHGKKMEMSYYYFQVILYISYKIYIYFQYARYYY